MIPLSFATCSATVFAFVPARNAVTSPPSLVAAVMTGKDCGKTFPPLCSRTARVLNNRWRRKKQRVEAVRRAARSTESLVGDMQIDMLVVGMKLKVRLLSARSMGCQDFLPQPVT